MFVPRTKSRIQVLFCRLVIPDRHAEAITSRPLLLHGIGKQTSHAGQTRLIITSSHAGHEKIKSTLQSVARFFKKIRLIAEQLPWEEKWRLILSRIFAPFLNGRLLQRPKIRSDFSSNCRI